MFSLTIVDHVRLDSEHIAKNYTVHARAAERIVGIVFTFRIAITALLAVASSEDSAFLYSSFVCQAVGARSVGWGRSFFVSEAKVIALSRCARRSGICTISYCVPGY